MCMQRLCLAMLPRRNPRAAEAMRRGVSRVEAKEAARVAEKAVVARAVVVKAAAVRAQATTEAVEAVLERRRARPVESLGVGATEAVRWEVEATVAVVDRAVAQLAAATAAEAAMADRRVLR